MAQIKKNQLANIIFPMVDKTDFASIESGITASDFNSAATKKIFGVTHGNSTAFTSAAISKATSLVHSGIFQQTLKATETNYDYLVVRFTHPSCADQILIFQPVDYDDSDLMSRLSDIGSDLLSYLTGLSGMLSDVDSQLLLNASMASDAASAAQQASSRILLVQSAVSDVESALDSQFAYISNALSDLQSDLTSQIGGITATVSVSDISDIASAVWANTIGARVDSRVLLIQSNVSDVQSAITLLATSNYLSQVHSDLSSQIGGITATVGASDISDIASAVWAFTTRKLTSNIGLNDSDMSDIRSAIAAGPAATVTASDISDIASAVYAILASDISDILSAAVQTNSRVLVTQSLVSDVQSALDSQFAYLSNTLSDIQSDLTSQIGGITASVGASDISDIASAVYAILSSDISDILSAAAQGNSRILVVQSMVSDVDSQLTLNASVISDIYSLVSNVESQLDVTHSLLSDVESAVDVGLTGVSATKYAGPYGPGVYYDDAAANTNTTLGTDGTVGNPVSTLAAALTLTASLGSKRIYVVGESTLSLTGQTLTDYEFVGIGPATSNILNLGTAASPSILTGCTFRHLYIYGQHDFSDRLEILDSILDDAPAAEITKVHCWARGCALAGNISLDTSDDNVFDLCFSGVAGAGYPVVAATGVTGTVVFRHYSGGVGFDSLSASHKVSVETDGQVVFEATCNVNAVVVVRGMATIVDSTAGMNNLTKTATAQYLGDFISDVDSQLLLNASMLSDVQSALDSQFVYLSNTLSDLQSDLTSQIGGITVSVSASDISDIASAVKATLASDMSDILSAAQQTNSRALVIQSHASDIYSLLSDVSSDLTVISGVISDIYSLTQAGLPLTASDLSDIRSAIAAGPAATITASDLSDIASRVWANATRTLTQAAASVTAVVTGTTVTVYRGTTWSIALTSLGDLTNYDSVFFSVKANLTDLDSDAVLKVYNNASGLLRLNGAAPTAATNGTVTINNAAAGNITITVEAAETQKAPLGSSYVYDVKGIDDDGNTDIISAGGTFVISGDVTRAVASP